MKRTTPYFEGTLSIQNAIRHSGPKNLAGKVLV